MPQRVRVQIRAPRAEGAIAPHQLLKPTHSQPLAQAPEQERLRILSPILGVPELVTARQVGIQREQGLRPDRDDALLAPLPQDAPLARLERELLQIERAK